MPDEDELELGDDDGDGDGGPSVADVLLVDALMGWDGDPCRCQECACPRFLDGSDDALCGPCMAGDHWRAHG